MQARGFTLLELIIVLGLTSVLLTIGVFGFAALRERLALSSAARQIVTDLTLARIRAIARNREQRLLFTTGTAAYRSQEKDGGTFHDIDSARRLPAGIRIAECTAPGDALGFRPRGGAAGFGTVVLSGASNETRSVTVSITGRTRIQ